MKNPFPYTLDNKRYQTWNYYLRNRFGKKVYKVPVSLGTTCPNRDGSKSKGGCTFCLSGGGGTPYIKGLLGEQFAISKAPMEAKWPDSLAMPYFQSFSNTYVPAEDLSSAIEEVLDFPNVIGVCVATRPDCLGDDIIKVLEKFNKKTFLLVELGLQTIHDKTADKINRAHTYNDFLDGYNKLAERDIPVCVHLINGLPCETPRMMLETAREVAKLKPHSVKFHMLHILEGTVLADEYRSSPFPLLTREEYVSTVCDQIEVLPPETVVQRVTGDPPADYLIEPRWTTNKLWVRNAIDKEMARRNSYQGIKYDK